MLAEQAKRLLASDVVWDDLFQTPGDADPRPARASTAWPCRSRTSSATSTSSSAATFAEIVKRIKGASTGGTSSGLHGTGIESVTAQPQGLVLSRVADNKVVASTNLAFEVAVKNTGDNLESKIPVTLTIQKQGAPIKQTQTIDVINPGEIVEGHLQEHRRDRRFRLARDPQGRRDARREGGPDREQHLPVPRNLQLELNGPNASHFGPGNRQARLRRACPRCVARLLLRRRWVSSAASHAAGEASASRLRMDQVSASTAGWIAIAAAALAGSG